MTKKTMKFPTHACDFGAETLCLVDAVPASATAPTQAAQTRQEEAIPRRAVEPARSREDAIRETVEPEQAELVEELVALEEVQAFLALDLFARCEELEQQLQRSAE